MSKQKFFELVFIALHSLNTMRNQCKKDLYFAISSVCKASKSQCKKAIEAVEMYDKLSAKVEDLIDKATDKYDLEKMTSIEKTIIQTSLFFFFQENLDKHIVISEGIRMTKKFGNLKAIPFVHFIIDKSIKLHELS